MTRYRLKAAEKRAVDSAVRTALVEAKEAIAVLVALRNQVQDAVEGDGARSEAERVWINILLWRLTRGS